MEKYEKVMAIGGSFYTENIEKTPKIAEAIGNHSPTAIIVGAGKLKQYINSVDSNEAEKDLIGIKATRLNAYTLSSELNANSEIPETVEQIKKLSRDEENIVLGGLNPGFSTDAVAAITAELLDSKLYIYTDVNGVYTSNPKKKDSVKLDEVEVEELREILKDKSNKAGSYKLIDKTALNIIERSKIETKILEGSIKNIEEPEKAEGTLITF